MENFILRVGQLDGLTVDNDLVVHAQHQLLLLRLCVPRPLIDGVAPQQGADPCNELRRRKGLAEIVVAPGYQGRHLFRLPGHGGEKQNGGIAALPDEAAGVEAVQALHHDIQNDQLHSAVQPLQRLFAASGHRRVVALALQQQLDDLGDVSVVIDDQNFPCHSPPLLC